MKDTDLMPFGKHKGEEMQEVPARYLMWLKNSYEGKPVYGLDNQNVYSYILDNLSVIEKELKEERKLWGS